MTRPYTFKKRTPSLLAALITTISAHSLYAQTHAAATEVEEVIVTAAKRTQRLQDFSGAISVVNRFEGIANLGDIARQVPGLSLVDAGPRNPTGIIIRGLRMDEVGSNDLGGDGATVTSYVDNIPLQGYFVPPAISLKDLQQVEVLRGPQGTLYGNASIGGLIRYVTAKPDLGKHSMSATGEISQTHEASELNHDSDIVVNAPLIDDTLGVRLLLANTRNQGFIDNPYLLSGPEKEINGDETDQARASVLWQVNDDFSLSGFYQYQKINVDDRQATNESFTGDEYTASSRYLQPMQGELQLAAIDANYSMAWATLTASINHYDYAHEERADITDFYITYDEVVYDNSYYTLYDDLRAFNTSTVDVIKDSVELRLVSLENQPLRWLVGGFYSRDDLDVYMGDYMPGFGEFLEAELPGDLEYLTTQTETLDEYSAYAEVIYALTDKVDVSVGGRYVRYDDDLQLCTTYYPSEGIPSCENGDDVSNNAFGKLGGSYKLTEDKNIYVALAEGYRRGGANLLPVGETTHSFYNPDTAINYELGFRSSWMDQRVQFNAALYRIDWDDIQVSVTSDEGRRYWDNAGEARTQGLELDASAQLYGALILRTNYTYVDAQTTEAVESLAINDGDRLPGSPRTHATIALDYTKAMSGADLEVSISVQRTGEVYTALNSNYYNYQKLESFNTANARVGVILRNWRFGAFVNNINNTRGITGARSNEWYGEQGKFEYITRPRTIGVSVNYQY